jgi:hypothetical protein
MDSDPSLMSIWEIAIGDRIFNAFTNDLIILFKASVVSGFYNNLCFFLNRLSYRCTIAMISRHKHCLIEMTLRDSILIISN